MARAAASDLEAALDRVEREQAGSAARILRCAERLFADRGFDGVTTRDVAAAAGVNVATLHFHWRDKRTLYEAVCRLQARQLLRFLERVDASTGPRAQSQVERVEGWVDQALDLLVANPAIARLAWQSVSGQSAPDLPTLLRHDLGVFRSLQAAIHRAAGGESRDAALILLAVFYFAVGIFSDSPLQCAVLEGSVHESPQLRRRVKRFARTLVRLLLQAPPDAE